MVSHSDHKAVAIWIAVSAMIPMLVHHGANDVLRLPKVLNLDSHTLTCHQSRKVHCRLIPRSQYSFKVSVPTPAEVDDCKDFGHKITDAIWPGGAQFVVRLCRRDVRVPHNASKFGEPRIPLFEGVSVLAG
jgi:hypothetical protein